MFRPLLATLSSASLGRFDLIVCSAKMPARDSKGSNCDAWRQHCKGSIRSMNMPSWCTCTHIILLDILDAPAVTAWQLHDLPLQPPLSGITRHGLGPCADGRFVIRANPWCQALVWHLTGDIGIQGSQELVVQVFLVAMLR